MRIPINLLWKVDINRCNDKFNTTYKTAVVYDIYVFRKNKYASEITINVFHDFCASPFDLIVCIQTIYNMF